MSYARAREDHEYLWRRYGPAADMTGAYQDSDDLRRLLRTPNKTTARAIYVDQILYWFEVGPENGVTDEMRRDWMLREIAERHGANEELLK